MVLIPIRDNVIVKPDEATTKLVNGLYMPESSSDKMQTGVIVSLGSDIAMNQELKVGEKVIFGKFSGTEVQADDQVYRIMNFCDIICKVTGGTDEMV